MEKYKNLIKKQRELIHELCMRVLPYELSHITLVNLGYEISALEKEIEEEEKKEEYYKIIPKDENQ